MVEFERAIINKLLDKYEGSKLSKGGSDRNIKIKLTKDDKEFKTYKARDSYKYRASNDAILKELERKDFVSVIWYDGEFESLSLNVDNVNELYVYARRDNPRMEFRKVEEVLNQNRQSGFIGDFVEANLANMREKYTWFKSYFSTAGQLHNILKGLKAITELKSDTKIRDFSVNTYGDSKYFDTIKGKVAKVIKDFDPSCNAEDTDDILAEYNVIKNSTYALIKNNMIFRLNDCIINLNDLGFEYSLSDEMIMNMNIASITAKRVITVENLTSFYRFVDSDALIVYLGGFHNHTKKLLLRKIYDNAPNLEYLHFGDIDAGGIYIYDNLVHGTGIPFKPYKMGVNELKENASAAKTLTQNDRTRLVRMRQEERFMMFADVIDYMLDNNVKLEQEIMD